MPKFSKSTGYKMKGYTYPGESPLKIASVSGAQLVQSVGKTYDKYVNYGKIVGDELKKGFDKVKNPAAKSESEEEIEDTNNGANGEKKNEGGDEEKPVDEGAMNTSLGNDGLN